MSDKLLESPGSDFIETFPGDLEKVEGEVKKFEDMTKEELRDVITVLNSRTAYIRQKLKELAEDL